MSQVTFKSTPVTLEGNAINVGDGAPEVKVVNQDLAEFTIGGKQHNPQIIIAVPSLDTGVCATEAKTFNKKIAQISGVTPIVVSADLPFAMGRFCTTEGVDKLLVGSDFRGSAFAKAYGTFMADGALKGLGARAIFVIDKEGKVTYKELCSEVTNVPDYDAALQAVEAVAHCCGSCS